MPWANPQHRVKHYAKPAVRERIRAWQKRRYWATKKLHCYCIVCGGPLGHRRIKTCSEKCFKEHQKNYCRSDKVKKSRAAWAIKNREHIRRRNRLRHLRLHYFCIECGASLPFRKQRFCSNSCGGAHRRRRNADILRANLRRHLSHRRDVLRAAVELKLISSSQATRRSKSYTALRNLGLTEKIK